MNEQRAICAECGHTRGWHDREAARSMARGELPYERPCYREIGGRGCPCGAFRDSGEIAVAASAGGWYGTPTRASVLRNGILTLLLVVLGLTLLYAYRAQAPSITQIPLSQAIADVQAGQVAKVTIVASKATLELRSGERRQTTLPERDEIFQKALADYNTANPSRQIVIDYQQETATLSVIGSIFLSLLPVLLVGAFFLYMMRGLQRR